MTGSLSAAGPRGAECRPAASQQQLPRPGAGWEPEAAAAALVTDVETDAQGGGVCLEPPAKSLLCHPFMLTPMATPFQMHLWMRG